MRNQISNTWKVGLSLFVIGMFSGLYMGSARMNDIHKEEKLHNQRVISNCLEVIIGKKPKGKLCQK